MRRGFEKVSGYEYVNLPQRKTKQSAGYDIESAVDDVITPGETKLIPTGLKAYMCENEWMGIYIRSSIAVKHGIVLANSVAVIDSDYYNNNVSEIGKDEIKSAAYALLHKMHEDFDVSNREIVVIIDDFFYQIEYET